MDGAHFHLLVNHFPIIGTIIGFGILFFGIILKATPVRKTAYYLFIALALITIPVMLSGESAEEIVEHVQGVDHNYIETHESNAKLGLGGMLVLGLLSIVSLVVEMSKPSLSKVFAWIVLGVSIIMIGVMAFIGNQGGQIRHTEIRDSAFSISAPGSQGNQAIEDRDDDDDD